MDTRFMNSDNSKTSDPHRLLLNMLLFQVSAITIHGKILKKSCKKNKFKMSTPI